MSLQFQHGNYTPHMTEIRKLEEAIRKFAEDRDWDQFHTPKNLASALSVESAELLEIFQWLTDEEAKSSPTNPKIKARAEEELADIFIYLIKIADKMDIDIFDAAFSKLKSNAEKYPVDKAKGSAKKYNEL